MELDTYPVIDKTINVSFFFATDIDFMIQDRVAKRQLIILYASHDDRYRSYMKIVVKTVIPKEIRIHPVL